MKRALLLLAGAVPCLIALGLPAEEKPLAARVEHFFVASDKAQSLFTFFKNTFQLPEVWPFYQHETFSSGGLSLGNAVLEFASFAGKDKKPMKTEFQGIALEPVVDANATAAELAKRDILHTDARTYASQVPGHQIRAEWSSVGIMEIPPTNADIFFCDYKDRDGVAQGRKAASDELIKRMGGPLGIVGAAEISVGVRNLEEAWSKWNALLGPAPRISDDAFVFRAGPRIRLVRSEAPGIQGIVLTVRSLDEAEKFLKERRLLAKDHAGHISISSASIDGLSIQLIDGFQSEKSGHPLLGHGRGVDHVGIGVRDLEKARRDYEDVLGFKCTENLTSVGDRALIRSIIFFEDETLLEFLSPSPGAPASGDEFRDWVEKHEGGMSLALRVSSARAAAAYLEDHNFEVNVTGWPKVKEGETKRAAVQYYSVTTPDAPSGNRQVFLTWIWLFESLSSPERAAKRAARREQGLMVHPNTARRLYSAWFAVCDMDASLKNIQDAGFEPGEPREAKFLGGKGREVKAGDGCMLLLQSIDKNGVVAKFLSDRRDGEIICVSIEVSDVDRARSLIESGSGHKLEPYDGFYGRSILIPPALAHGDMDGVFPAIGHGDTRRVGRVPDQAVGRRVT